MDADVDESSNYQVPETKTSTIITYDHLLLGFLNVQVIHWIGAKDTSSVCGTLHGVEYFRPDWHR